jgi:hypothetical protein
MTSETLLRDLRGLLETEERARLGPERRAGVLSLGEIDDRLAAAFAEHHVPSVAQDLLKATLYLWHDHLEASHRLAQEIEGPDGSLVHGLMHRREPDFSNAKYWFRRVGPHPSFLTLALRGTELLNRHEESDLQSRLLPNKTWDPFAFVDAVEDAATGRFRSRVPLLEGLQRLEFECFVENLVHRA